MKVNILYKKSFSPGPLLLRYSEFHNLGYFQVSISTFPSSQTIWDT